MKIRTITFTGADDHTDISEMVQVSNLYPQVEWGILVGSGNNKPRFPSHNWIEDLIEQIQKHSLNVSCHVCGKYMDNLLAGESLLADDVGYFIRFCQRIQLNTHAQPVPDITGDWFDKMITCLRRFPGKTIIIQLDGVNDWLLPCVKTERLDAVGLFDLSHGAGIVPVNWPKPGLGRYMGYAGGLGPDNIEEQLVNIAQSAGDNEVWIDMETKVRNKDNKFDIGMVKKVLDIAGKYF